VVLIGGGIGGLACGALLARYGFDVVVCESHTTAGGAAHAFTRDGYRFDSGPSLFSGLSAAHSANPLRQVLDALGESLPCATYDTWGCCLPEGDFDTQVGADQFCDVLERLRGPVAAAEWRALQRLMAPLAEAAVALPTAAVRFDAGVVRSVAPVLGTALRQAGRLPRLVGPFADLLPGTVSDPFIRNWLDLLCFLLSGLPADGTIAAEVAFMFAEWYRPGVVLDYPLGGTGALVDALVRALKRRGGQLLLGAHVKEILVSGGQAAGVRLADGHTIRASRAVVSAVSIWDTLKLLPQGALPRRFRERRAATPECASFLHLHLGFDAADLPALPCHTIVVNDWARGVDAPQNVVLISIPSVLDPSLAPPGHHVVHAYTPGSEPYDLWAGLDRRDPAYAKLKEERAAVLWQAMERVVPDIRARTEVVLVGTPLTHERFLRRHRGSYGPAIRAGEGLFPGPRTPLAGLLCCGDSTFPGIGLPAVAASALICANTLAPLSEHRKLLRELGYT